MIKADLHIHANCDPEHMDDIDYNTIDVINKAIENRIDVISFTCHNFIYFDFNLANKFETDLIIIPGVEVSIGKKHLLVYIKKDKELILKYNKLLKENKFDLDFIRAEKENGNILFVLVPHPFYLSSSCFGSDINQIVDLIDGIEYSWFHMGEIKYIPLLNGNNRAKIFAKKNNLPLYATSDLHRIEHFSKYYSILACKKTFDEFVAFVKSKKQPEIVSPALSLIEYAKRFFRAFYGRV